MSSSHDMTSTHSDSRCRALAADLLPRRSVGAPIPRAGECSTAHTYLGPGNVQRREDPRVRVRFVPRSTARIWQHAGGDARLGVCVSIPRGSGGGPQEIPCPWKPWPLTPSTTLASRATSIRCYSRVDAFTSDGAAQLRTASHSTSLGRAASGRYNTNRCKCWRASQATRGSKTSSRYRSCASMDGSEYGAAAGVN